MDKDTKLLLAAALVSQTVLLGVVFLQNRSMKKNNAEAERVVEEAGEVIKIVENACDSSIEALRDDTLDPAQQLERVREQFQFISVVLDDKDARRHES